MSEGYRFAVLDPRPQGVEANEKVFDGPVYGIEITVPALAARCVRNIDPQHTGGNAELAAIEVAVGAELPPVGTTLATVRADLDSVGAMALFSIRARGGLPEFIRDLMSRVEAIAEADKFARGAWPGVRPLETFSEESDPLAAIAVAVADFKVPIATRVAWVERWLLIGEEPEEYRSKVEREHQELGRAIADGTIYAKVVDGVALVVSTHPSAIEIGYRLAPMVVAMNPIFRFQGGEPHRKFTVAQHEEGHAMLWLAREELNKFESGWGGSPTIIGSPQGVESTLSAEEVLRIVSGKRIIGASGPDFTGGSSYHLADGTEVWDPHIKGISVL